MITNSLQMPISIEPFPYHNVVKEHLLYLIDIDPGTSANKVNDDTHGGIEQITKTDWYRSERFSNNYFTFIEPFLTAYLYTAVQKFTSSSFIYGSYWYQQYLNGDQFGWHNHAQTNLNIVYYVELPDGSPGTEFLDPVDKTTVFSPSCKEGDIVIFPSILYHRSPPNPIQGRKTSFVINLVC